MFTYATTLATSDTGVRIQLLLGAANRFEQTVCVNDCAAGGASRELEYTSE